VSDNLKRKGAGRPKGSPNKLGKAAKDAIAAAAEELGGHERLVAWAKEAPENERAFWVQVYPKLIPVSLSGDPENPVHTVSEIVIRAVDAASDRPSSEG
jgi:hypothetical protein